MRLFEVFEKDPEYFESEDSLSQTDIRAIFDGVLWMSSNLRRTNLGAALFYSLSNEDKIEYFNKFVIPLYQQHKLPIPGKPPYGPFQDDVKKLWRFEKQDDVDYNDPAVVKKILNI